MTDVRESLRAELARLVSLGGMLHGRELLAHSSREERDAAAAKLAPELAVVGAKKTHRPAGSELGAEDEAKVRSAVQHLLSKPNFSQEYQGWYSPALRVVAQVLPDRLDEFTGLYRYERRKQLDVETYSITDYIARLTVTTNFGSREAFSARSVAMEKFARQIDILRTAEARLDSLLTEITRQLQAALLDDEVASARALLSASHVRSAGVVAGVVLEAHLKRLAIDHSVSLGRRRAVLASLNGALKDADVYDIPAWRRIQFLTDIRNLCAHKSERDPSTDEVRTMIDDVDKIVKTLF